MGGKRGQCSYSQPRHDHYFLEKKGRELARCINAVNNWEWIDMAPLDAPIGDPQDVVGRKTRGFWDHDGLKPHDSNLRKLDYEDC